MEWLGINQNNAATGPGAWLAVGCDFDVEGEIGRRAGMALGVSQSGTALISIWNPAAGRFVVFVDGDTVVSEAV